MRCASLPIDTHKGIKGTDNGTLRDIVGDEGIANLAEENKAQFSSHLFLVDFHGIIDGC